jgi:hypothetical protein
MPEVQQILRQQIYSYLPSRLNSKIFYTVAIFTKCSPKEALRIVHIMEAALDDLGEAAPHLHPALLLLLHQLLPLHTLHGVVHGRVRQVPPLSHHVLRLGHRRVRRRV